MASKGGGSGSSSSKALSKEEILSGFQALRQEQRQIANKMSELEQELTEHRVVAETLAGVAGERRCWRLVGGVLVERSAAAVRAELLDAAERLPHAIAALEHQLQAKGVEINEYAQQHELRLHKPGSGNGSEAAAAAAASAAAPAQPNVLVSAN